MRWLHRWANASAVADIERLESEKRSLLLQTRALQGEVDLLKAEVQLLTDVVSRNHERVKAERQIAIQRQARAENAK